VILQKHIRKNVSIIKFRQGAVHSIPWCDCNNQYILWRNTNTVSWEIWEAKKAAEKSKKSWAEKPKQKK